LTSPFYVAICFFHPSVVSFQQLTDTNQNGLMVYFDFAVSWLSILSLLNRIEHCELLEQKSQN